MGSLYSGTSVSGYNANPPPDDGTQVAVNEVDWSKIKTKLGDPLNTFAGAQDPSIVTAFGKTLDGATVVTTAVSYAATAADQGRLIKVTVSGQTVTTPDAGTVTAPFVFAVNNQSTGTITLAGNATGAQTVDGSTTQTIQSGGSCIVKTDGTNWYTIGFKPASNTLSGNNYGFDSAVNLNLQASVGSSLLTVALKTKAGNDPSASDPIQIPFRDTTITNGDPVWISITGALSINTNAVGATLASQNTTPFRFWVVAFNNAGTVVLALWHSGAGASSIALNPLNEGTLQSTTPISAAANAAGVFYTPNGTTLSSKAFRILGYLEYTAGLTTAGTYATAPNIVQLFGPGVKKPGDTVQTIYSTRTSNDSTSSATLTITGANLTATIVPSSAANLAEITASVNAWNGTTADGVGISMFRGAGAIGNQSAFIGITGTNQTVQLPLYLIDQPNTTSSTVYTVGFRATTGGTANLHNGSTGSGSSLVVKELMG